MLALSRWEKAGAFHGDVRVPLGAVEDVCITPNPLEELRGLRAPGTGLPWGTALGTWRRRGRKDFVALRRGRPAVIVRLRDSQFERLLVSADDPDAVAADIERHRPRPATASAS